MPATLPIAWLAHRPVRDAVESLAQPGEVAIHEDQTFDYRHPLQPGRTYRVHATVQRQVAPARLLIEAELQDDGGTVVTVRTALRLVPVGAPPTP